jgi:hypothetical protein
MEPPAWLGATATLQDLIWGKRLRYSVLEVDQNGRQVGLGTASLRQVTA